MKVALEAAAKRGPSAESKDSEETEGAKEKPVPKAKPRAEPKEEPKAEAKPEKPKPGPAETKEFIALRQERKRAADAVRESEARAATVAAKEREVIERMQALDKREKGLSARDPEAVWAHLRELGITARDVVRMSAEESKGAPKESSGADPALAQKLADLESKLAAREAEEAERAQKLSASEDQARELAILTSNYSAESHPYLADERPEEVYDAVISIYNEEFQPLKRPLDLPKILARLESKLREAYAAKLARVTPQTVPANPRRVVAKTREVTSLDTSAPPPALGDDERNLPYRERRKLLARRLLKK